MKNWTPHYHPIGKPDQDFFGSTIKAPNHKTALMIARERAAKLDLVVDGVRETVQNTLFSQHSSAK